MHVKNASQEQERKRLGLFKDVFRKKEISLWHIAERHINNAEALYAIAHGKFSLRGVLYPRNKDPVLEAANLYHAAAIDFIVSGHPLRAAESFERSADLLIEHCNDKAAKLYLIKINSGAVPHVFPPDHNNAVEAAMARPFASTLNLAAWDYLTASVLYGEGHRRGRSRSYEAAFKIFTDLGFNANDMSKAMSRTEVFVSRVANQAQQS